MTGNLPPFPSCETPVPRVSQDGLALRRAGAGDMPFLRTLYGDTRATELAAMPWPDFMRRDFLDSQFALQHTHYVRHFPRCDFLVVERDDEAVGRFYVDERGKHLHVVDISVLATMRGHGVGTSLLRGLMAHAASRGGGVTLQVDACNARAQSLYRRLGFRQDGATSTHLAMRWIS